MTYIYNVKNYDYIIIDVGPEAGQLMTMAMLASDFVIAVTDLSRLAYKGIVKMAADLKPGKEHYMNFNVRPLGILINESQKTNVGALNRERFVEISSEFGAAPFKTEIKNSCVMNECKEFCLAMNEYKPKHDISKQYRELTKEIKKRIKEMEKNV